MTGGYAWQEGMHGRRGCMAGGDAWQEGMCSRGEGARCLLQAHVHRTELVLANACHHMPQRSLLIIVVRCVTVCLLSPVDAEFSSRHRYRGLADIDLTERHCCVAVALAAAEYHSRAQRCCPEPPTLTQSRVSDILVITVS